MRRCCVGVFVLVCVTLTSSKSRADPGDALDTSGGGIAASYVVHAQAAINQGRYSEAIDLCDRAIAIYPHFIRAHFDRGRALAAGGQYDLAIGEYGMVIAAHPEYPLVYMVRGEAYLDSLRPEQAIADFNQALTTEVGMSSLMGASVFAYRSLAYELAGQVDASVADFQRALKAMSGDTRDYGVLNDYCYAAALVGLLQSAMAGCDASISRHSRNEAAYDSRGLAHLKGGEWDLAIADYSQALYYRADLPTSRYGRGVARRAKGDRAAGEADIAVAKTSEPHIEDIMARFGVLPQTKR